MREQIRSLGADTAVYGISTIVGRFLSFLLVFFYTNVLAPGDYGIVAYVYSLIAFVGIIYGYGLESAYFKYASTGEHGSDRETFSTPLIALTISSFVLSSAISLAAPAIARWTEIPAGHADVIAYAAWILFLDTVSAIPFAALRLERKARFFALLKVLNIVVNVAANVLLLLWFHLGVDGIFLSGLIASASTWILLLPTTIRRLDMHRRPGLFRTMFRFGVPYVPAGLASMMIQVVDRPILRALTNDATVGIYQANYRLGIFMMLIVSMYDYAWRPFFLLHAKDPDAKTLFSRVLTYFVLIGTVLTLLLSLFIEDLVKIRVLGHALINSEYWSGLPIVPVVLTGYLFLGIYNNLIAGIYIREKTQYLPAITFVGALVNVGANLLLIPRLGMMGAAIATLAAYAGMALTLYIVVRRIYPVAYEWGRIGLIMASGLGCFALYAHVPVFIHPFVWKIGLTGLFVLALLALKVVRWGEITNLLKST